VNWFVFRQHRKQFIVFGVLLALFATLLIPTSIHYWNTYQHALSTCHQFATPTDPNGNCNSLDFDTLFPGSLDGLIKLGVVLGTFGLPILAGLFIGSPLIAREYEEGTDKLVWTQSVSRRKWLTTKLTWALGFALVYGTLLAILVTWWSRTPNALMQNRFVQGHFETQGLMPVAYSLFFTAIGFMTGAWFRKTLLAFAITFSVFVVCMASFAQWIRPHAYMAPITVTAPMGPGGMDDKLPHGAIWVTSRNIVDKNGKGFNSFDINNMPSQCQQLIRNGQVSGNSKAVRVMPGKNGGDPIDDCLNAAGYHQVATYQPAYRYWDFQRIEAGIYLGMTALAVSATYWLVLKRDA
jgi:ABC-type transport system involved in multi-copper enzyme maturation permease subunit